MKTIMKKNARILLIIYVLTWFLIGPNCLIKSSADGEIQDNILCQKGTYINSNNEKTTYYLVTVPLHDDSGEIIPIVSDYDEEYSPVMHAKKNRTRVTANSGMTLSHKQGAVINNGRVIKESEYLNKNPYLVYVGFDENRQVYEYSMDTDPAIMLADGIRNASIAYYRLVTDCIVRDVSQIGLSKSNLKQNPRMAMFVKEDGAVCFLACDGRNPDDAGLTPYELGYLMVGFGAVDGWNLDGGGSTSLSLNGVKLNKNIDGNGTVDRNIHVTWNVP